VPPLEISKRDLQSVFDELFPLFAFLTVFAYPALFRIRADLSSSHAFREFSGREDESYELSAGQDGSIVTPRMPFSLTDRVEWLRKEGFRASSWTSPGSGSRNPSTKR
jgi:putative protease